MDEPLVCAGGPGLTVDGRVDALDGDGQVGGGVSREDEEQAGAHGLLLGRVAMHVLWHFRQTGTFSPEVPERMVSCGRKGELSPLTPAASNYSLGNDC